MGKRDISIDVAKGLGIFLIVLGHSQISEGYCNLLIYSFHIPLFFLLSGIFHKQQISFFQLIKSKSRGLLLPYVFFSLFSYFFYLVWALLFTGIDTFDFYSIYQLIPYKDAISVPLWFFISLFEVMIIYYLLKKNVKQSWFLLLITLSISFFSYCISQLQLPYFYNFFHVFSSFSMLFFYALGCEVFNDFRARIVPNAILFKVIFSLVVLLFFVYINTFSKGIDVNGNFFNAPFYMYIFAAITGIYTLWLVSVLINELNLVSRFWVFVGENSMGIFAIHLPMFELARPLVKMVATAETVLSGFIVATVTLIISLGVNEVLKFFFPFVYGFNRKKLIFK